MGPADPRFQFPASCARSWRGLPPPAVLLFEPDYAWHPDRPREQTWETDWEEPEFAWREEPAFCLGAARAACLKKMSRRNNRRAQQECQPIRTWPKWMVPYRKAY